MSKYGNGPEFDPAVTRAVELVIGGMGPKEAMQKAIDECRQRGAQWGYSSVELSGAVMAKLGTTTEGRAALQKQRSAR